MSGPALRLQRLEARRERVLRAAVRHLDVYARLCWDLLEGRPLVWSWYHTLICRELEAVSRAETQDLVICIPPRCTKSYLVAVFFPSWHWLREPGEGILSVANDERVSGRDSLRARHILLSPIYEELRDIAIKHHGTPEWTLDPSQQVKVNYRNTRGGERQALSITSRTTGKGCDIQLLDDLLDAREVGQATPERRQQLCEDAWQTVTEFLGSRFNDRQRGRRVMVAQRLTENDPPGMAIRAGWRHVVLPMHGNPAAPLRHPTDTRAYGELLDPTRFPPTVMEKLEADLGPQAAAQLEQDPAPAKGGLLDEAWLDGQHYPEDPLHLAQACDEVVISADAAKKPTGASDYHGIQVWGRQPTRRLLLGYATARMDYPTFERTMDRLIVAWAPRCPGRLVVQIEDTANGTTYLQVRARRWIEAVRVGYEWVTLADWREQLPAGAQPDPPPVDFPAQVPLIPFHPNQVPGTDKSKPARFLYFTRAAEGRQVWTPDPAKHPWVSVWKANIMAFPKASHDDDADTTSQVFVRWALQPDPAAEMAAFAAWLGG